MQIESVLQTKNRSEPAKNRFSVALEISVNLIKVMIVFDTKTNLILWKKMLLLSN